MDDIAIVGGGASGLMAGISAAREVKRARDMQDCIAWEAERASDAHAVRDCDERGAHDAQDRNGGDAQNFKSSYNPRITIYESTDKVGRSILRSGNGRCNFTNTRIGGFTRDDFRAIYHNGDYVCDVVESFRDVWGGSKVSACDTHGDVLTCKSEQMFCSNNDREVANWQALDRKIVDNDVLQFFESLGLVWREEVDGRTFPLSGKASTILNLLRNTAGKLGVQEQVNTRILRIEPRWGNGEAGRGCATNDFISGANGAGFGCATSGVANVVGGAEENGSAKNVCEVSRPDYFILHAEDGRMLHARQVILATGGKTPASILDIGGKTPASILDIGGKTPANAFLSGDKTPANISGDFAREDAFESRLCGSLQGTNKCSDDLQLSKIRHIPEKPVLVSLEVGEKRIVRALDNIRVKCAVSLWRDGARTCDEAQTATEAGEQPASGNAGEIFATVAEAGERYGRAKREGAPSGTRQVATETGEQPAISSPVKMRLIATEAGEVLFRKYGVSGIAVFNLSRHAQLGDILRINLMAGALHALSASSDSESLGAEAPRALGATAGALLVESDVSFSAAGAKIPQADLCQDATEKLACDTLIKIAHSLRNLTDTQPTYEDILRGIVQESVARAVMKIAGVSPDGSVRIASGEVSDIATEVAPESYLSEQTFGNNISIRSHVQSNADPNIKKIAHALCNFDLTVAGAGDAKLAQVHRGGFATNCIDPKTMQMRALPGLFITGEALDVDAPCGGYNLHWAWVSGMLAGISAGGRAVG